MKLRSGFVSNSSSCSFVILGVKLTEEEFQEKFEDVDVYAEIEQKGLNIVDEMRDDIIVGKIIAAFHDTMDDDEKEISFPELNSIIENVSTGLNVSREKIKIYTGTMPC